MSQGCSFNQTPTSTSGIVTETPDDWIIPTPSQNAAVVFGTMRYVDESKISGSIFLAKNLSYENPNLPPTISFSYQNSPRGRLDKASGNFYFEDLDPADNYVILIMINPNESIIVIEEGSDYPFMINVIAGDSIDLGLISVQTP